MCQGDFIPKAICTYKSFVNPFITFTSTLGPISMFVLANLVDYYRYAVIKVHSMCCTSVECKIV